MSDANFIKRAPRRGLLIGSIVASLSISVFFAGALLLRSSNRDSLSATIGSVALESPTSTSDHGYPAAPSVPVPLSDSPAISLTSGIGSDTARYYESQTGKAFQVDLRSHVVGTLSDKKLTNFNRAIWAPDKKQVIGVFAQPGTAEFRYYNYETAATARIGSAPVSTVFAPDSRRIAFVDSQSDHLTLYVANPDGSDAHKVLDTRLPDPELSWPSRDILVLSSRHGTGSARDLTLVGTDGSMAPLLSGMDNLEYAWSRDGSKLLYSYYRSDGGVSLWYLDLASRLSVPLGVATSAGKCAWHPDDTLVTCGVPGNTILSRDVSAARSATLDDVVTIDTSNGTQKKIYAARSGTYIGVIEPFVSSSGSFFVFANLFDRRVYSLAF